MRVTVVPQKSLVIVARDNRSGTLDRCELTYTRRGANGSAYDSTETVSNGPVPAARPVAPGDVHCAGVAVDRQGRRGRPLRHLDGARPPLRLKQEKI